MTNPIPSPYQSQPITDEQLEILKKMFKVECVLIVTQK